MLAEALAELADLRSASRARGEGLAALRRAEAARAGELETARRRLAEAERLAGEETTAADGIELARAEVVARLEAARRAAEFAAGAEARSASARESARVELESAEAARATAAARVETAASAAAALRGQVDALAARLDEEERRPIARAARRAGGRRLDEDLTIDPELRAAVEAALAERTRAYLVAAQQVDGLASERGRLIIEERLGGSAPVPDAATRRLLEAVAAGGGGRLSDGIRRDASGGVRRLLERAVWLPDLAACLAIQGSLPAGWVAVARDGSAVVDDVGVALGAVDSVLERRADHARLSVDAETAESALATLRSQADGTLSTATTARTVLERAREEEARAAAERRRADEAERAAAREAEAVTRESAWHTAQRARLDTGGRPPARGGRGDDRGRPGRGGCSRRRGDR